MDFKCNLIRLRWQVSVIATRALPVEPADLLTNRAEAIAQFRNLALIGFTLGVESVIPCVRGARGSMRRFRW